MSHFLLEHSYTASSNQMFNMKSYMLWNIYSKSTNPFPCFINMNELDLLHIQIVCNAIDTFLSCKTGTVI